MRLALERLGGGIALDRTIDFPANADSVPLALSVELSAGSTIRIASDGAVGLVILTVANGFTNLGAIDLTSTVSTFTSQLTVTNGTLLNRAGGAISALAGTGVPRDIFAPTGPPLSEATAPTALTHRLLNG